MVGVAVGDDNQVNFIERNTQGGHVFLQRGGRGGWEVVSQVKQDRGTVSADQVRDAVTVFEAVLTSLFIQGQNFERCSFANQNWRSLGKGLSLLADFIFRQLQAGEGNAHEHKHANE